jgi:hypothetical protein
MILCDLKYLSRLALSNMWNSARIGSIGTVDYSVAAGRGTHPNAIRWP